MDWETSTLRTRRDRAARRLLAVEAWQCPRSAVTWAVETLVANSARSTAALGWLLKQMRALPDQSVADACLVDLSLAIADLANAEARERRENAGRVVAFPGAAPVAAGVGIAIGTDQPEPAFKSQSS